MKLVRLLVRRVTGLDIPARPPLLKAEPLRRRCAVTDENDPARDGYDLHHSGGSKTDAVSDRLPSLGAHLA
jgi:hypothetical protein